MSEPTMTQPTEMPMPAEEAQLLADAQRRLEAKRASTTVEVQPIKRTLEETIERINNLPPRHIKPITELARTAVQELRTRAGIPPRHQFEIPDGSSLWHEKRATLVAMLGNGFLAAMSGKQGTGKTQMGSALIYTATTKRLTCRYALAMDFFIALKGTFEDGSKLNESQIIASFVKPKLLVLDECDERSESAWENRLLFHMINQRYNNLVDTLLISRQGETEFLQSLRPSLQSRIQETGGSLVCEWASFREGGQP